MRASPDVKNDKRFEIGVLYGFRAIMVLCVVNYHIWQQSWLPQYVTLLGITLDFDFLTRSSYVFVDGMMLLSGFLLYLPYARQKAEGTPTPGIKRFYFNRATRILPSYLAAILIALFCFALPRGEYSSASSMARDLLSHLSLTFTFWKDTYLYTHLNGALWTVAVEMQFYLIFPLLAWAARKRPYLTISVMALAGFAYRASVYFFGKDTAILINQMPAFLDVYALGMLGAILYFKVRKWLEGEGERQRALARLGALLAFVGCLCLVLALLRVQSAASLISHDELRLSQLRIRFPLAVALLGCALAAAYMPDALQWLLSNRLMRFLSTISFNLYIWHQFLAVKMRLAWFPESMNTDPGLQRGYTLLCLSVSVLTAMLATFGLEQPVTKLANKAILKIRRKKENEGSPSGKTQPPVDSILM